MDEIKTPEAATEQDALREWRPSRQPDHRAATPVDFGRLAVEQSGPGGILGWIMQLLRRPFVRLIIGLGLFIFAAITYDATINGGSWTIKAEKLKPSAHRGARAIPLTPE